MYAHTPRKSTEDWHGLEEHLKSVAKMATDFGFKLGLSDVCRELGLFHDVGKAHPGFQEYLLKSYLGEKAQTEPHAEAGAFLARNRLGSYAVAIDGHHAGIPNWIDFKIQTPPKIHPDVKALFERLAANEPGFRKEPESHLDVRMAFSALVDADWLDTEGHFSPAKRRLRNQSVSVQDLAQRLERYCSKFANPVTPVQKVREEIRRACAESASLNRGLFRLTAPTGGGKTISSLVFALIHAVHHGLDRVIVAAPYTTILDQTAEVYEDIFENGFLVHHSLIDPDEVSYTESLLTENWDSPLILTTNVQLFESLFSNKPGKCRKLHNIARSVIVLDEVQTLPLRFLKPILDVLERLVSRYGCSVVFCTATQPYYEAFVSGGFQAQEINSNFQSHFQTLERVDYTVLDVSSLDDFAKKVSSHPTCMAVLDTRTQARDLAKLVGDCEFLSTNLTPKHRRDVLKTVQRKLESGEPVRLISTQVVEAGVDIDFPVVFRTVGPLERIIQTAGRCNRHGRLDRGVCNIVNFPGAFPKTPDGEYRSMASRTKALIEKYGKQAVSEDVQQKYWKKVFSDEKESSTRFKLKFEKHIRQMAFEDISKEFNLIDSKREYIVKAPTYPYVREVEELLDGEPDRYKARRLREHQVSMYEDQKESEKSKSDKKSESVGFVNTYDPKFGFFED